MTQYLLLIYSDETALDAITEDERHAMFEQYGEYTKWLSEKGWMRAGDALHDTTQATNVRVKDGERIVTDGPFAETKEQLGGFYQIDVENLDDAIEAATRCPGSMFGTIEVRPIMAT